MELTKKIAEKISFAELLMHAKDLLAGTGDPELAHIRENADLMQYLMGKYEQVNTPTVVAELESRGLLVGETAEAPAPKPAPEPAAVEETAEEEEPEDVEEEYEESEEEEEDDLDAQAEAAMERDPDPEPEDTTEEEVSSPSLEDVESVLATIPGVSKEGKWVRTGQGDYVCPFCICEGKTGDDLFIADGPKSVGPHTRTHDNKDRSALDEILPSLPDFQEPEEEAAAPAPTAPDPEPEQPEVTDPEPAAATVPEHRTLEVEEDQVTQPAGVAAAALDADIKQFIAAEIGMLEERMEARMSRLEAVLANAVVAITSMSDEQRQQIFEGHAKHKAGILSEILTREI